MQVTGKENHKASSGREGEESTGEQQVDMVTHRYRSAGI